MVQFNFSERTIKAKVVYYGPRSRARPPTSSRSIASPTRGANRLISLNTAQDRTLFFDLLPFSLGRSPATTSRSSSTPFPARSSTTPRGAWCWPGRTRWCSSPTPDVDAEENVSAFENMKVNLLANRLVPEKIPSSSSTTSRTSPSSSRGPSWSGRSTSGAGKPSPPSPRGATASWRPSSRWCRRCSQPSLSSTTSRRRARPGGRAPDRHTGVRALVRRPPLHPGPAPRPARRHRPARGYRAGLPRAGGPEVGPGLGGAAPPCHPLERRARRGARPVRPRRQPRPRDDPRAGRPLPSPARTVARRGDGAAIRREVRAASRQMLREIGRAAAVGRAAAPRRRPRRRPRCRRRRLAAPPRRPARVPRPAAAPPAAGSVAAPAPPRPPPPPLAGHGRLAAASAPRRPGGCFARCGCSRRPRRGRPPVADALAAVTVAPAARPGSVESRIAGTAPLCRAARRPGCAARWPGRCRGWRRSGPPGSGIPVRAEADPSCSAGGRRRGEARLVMLALTQAGGLGEADQQRILKGSVSPGRLGEAIASFARWVASCASRRCRAARSRPASSFPPEHLERAPGRAAHAREFRRPQKGRPPGPFPYTPPRAAPAARRRP